MKRKRVVRGRGSIRSRRGSPFLYVDFTVTPYGETEARRYRESSGALTVENADSYIDRRKRELAAAPASTREAVTLADLETLLADDYRQARKHSLRHARRAFKVMGEFFGADATTEQVQARVFEFKAWGLAQVGAGTRYEPATVRRMLAVLRRASALAVEAGKLDAPIRIPTVKVDNARKGFFEERELRAVLRHLPEHLQPVAVFGSWTGWRKSEILGLTWDRVDRKAQTVSLDRDNTKNGEARSFPYGSIPDLVAVIEAQWDRAIFPASASGAGHVFLNRLGRPILDLDTAWRRACEAAGVPHRLFHDFRRTAARNLVRAGVPEQVAMKWTGHKTRSIFDRYAIVNDADLAEGARRVVEHRGVALLRHNNGTTTAQVVAKTGARGHFP